MTGDVLHDRGGLKKDSCARRQMLMPSRQGFSGRGRPARGEGVKGERREERGGQREAKGRKARAGGGGMGETEGGGRGTEAKGKIEAMWGNARSTSQKIVNRGTLKKKVAFGGVRGASRTASSSRP